MTARELAGLMAASDSLFTAGGAWRLISFAGLVIGDGLKRPA